MTSPGIPLRTCVNEVAKSPLKMLHQICPNPNFLSTSRRQAQETESKAFVISSLRRILGWRCSDVDAEILLFVAQA
jgi:hypothetical protein